MDRPPSDSPPPREAQGPTDLLRSAEVTGVMRAMLLACALAGLIALPTAWISEDHAVIAGCVVELALLVPLWLLLERGHQRLTALGIVVLSNALAAFLVITGGGIHDPGMGLFAAVIVLSGLLMDRRMGLGFALFATASAGAIGLAELTGLLRTPQSDRVNWQDVINVVIVYGLISALVQVLTRAFFANLERAHRIDQATRAAEKLQAVGQLAQGIAHDFNNQLTGILANASLLQRALPADSPMSEWARAIIECSNRSATLNQQLLAFARKGKRQTKRIDVNRMVEDVAALLERSLDKRIRITCTTAGAPAVIEGDETFLQNALLNLGVNARDAMPAGGELTLTVETFRNAGADNDKRVRIVVRDTGEGMAADVKDRIFEPFFTTKDSGHGMGLAAVYGTITAHDGSIEVDSTPGHGTTFRIVLPALDDPPDPVRDSMPAPASRLDDVRVLLAEDEEAVAKVCVTILDNAGCRVTRVADGHAALDALTHATAKFDVAVLDHSMPGLTGPEVVKRLRKAHVTIPIVSMSGFAQTQSLGDDLHPHAFVAKPFAAPELINAITKVLRQRR